ncbi:hypothetical protein [Burkholderia multivorans]|uniref:hypothetical protein n=1 Tax=Burkholderia multivorans TaxID=87883 RepID=UPI000CFE40A7|nr:hypothetical protein [Burkholderia multivorans]PRG40459.1 hypothetical protein C6T62_12725 [Burkholderia multivorans]
MSEIKNGGPAFPGKASINRSTGELQAHQFGNNDFETLGMSLRDYFAAKAMRVCAPRHVHPDSEVRYVAPISFDDLANDAYALADAMLRARGEA